MDNSTVCYRKNIWTSVFHASVLLLIDNEFHHNIVKVAVDPRGEQCYDKIHDR